jgi:hypothetical protein
MKRWKKALLAGMVLAILASARSENGKKFLDYLKSDRRFSALSLKDSLDEQGVR